MNIEKNINGKDLTLKIIGRIDANTAPDLDKELKAHMDEIEKLVIDLKELRYISSAGLRVVLSAQKIMNTKGSMKIINTQEMVMEVFESTGFTDIMTIE